MPLEIDLDCLTSTVQMAMVRISAGSMKRAMLLKGRAFGTYHMFAPSGMHPVSRLAKRNQLVGSFQLMLFYQGALRCLLHALFLGLVLLLKAPDT